MFLVSISQKGGRGGKNEKKKKTFLTLGALCNISF